MNLQRFALPAAYATQEMLITTLVPGANAGARYGLCQLNTQYSGEAHSSTLNTTSTVATRDSGGGAGNIQPFCRTARLMASSHWPGEGPCLPSSETGSPRVAPSAIHALLYVALASTAFSKRLLSQALRGGQGRAATCHTRHHGATRGASCRAHGVPQNLQGSGSHQREPAKPLPSRISSKVLDQEMPSKWGRIWGGRSGCLQF